MAWTKPNLQSLLSLLAVICGYVNLIYLPGTGLVELWVGGGYPLSDTPVRRLSNDQQILTKTHHKTVAPLEAGFCGAECRSILTKMRQLNCEQVAFETATRLNISLSQAVAVEIQKNGGIECEPCNAELCNDNSRLYRRYNEAAPAILGAKSSYLTTILKDRRIPRQLLQGDIVERNKQLESFFSDPSNVHPKRKYLFEYNPTLIKLPAKEIPNIKGETPVYLASYRVSTQQNCFSPNMTLQMIGGSWDNRPMQRDFLALALLRSNLTPIREVVTKVPRSLGKSEDFRLFVLHDQIYVGFRCKLVPLWLHQPDSLEGTFELANAMVRNPHRLKAWMGRQFTYCSSYWKDKDNAKNLNWFVDGSNNSVVEMNPLDPHIVHKVDLTDGKDAAPHPANATTDTFVPRSTFKTMEEIDLPNRFNFSGSPFTAHRGGACCIPFDDPRPLSVGKGKKLVLGVAHVKTPHGRKKLHGILKGNQYLSRWYAIEPVAPYRVVAMSGLWCLPTNPNSNHIFDASRDNPYENLPQWSPLEIAGRTYNDCPSIHFISGMTEKADDPGKLIVAYGVEDCTSWFVEVSIAEVIGLLFNPPPKEIL